MKINNLEIFVENLFSAFNVCETHLKNNQGGKMRSDKGNVVVDLIECILKDLIIEKPICNATIKRNYSIAKGKLKVSCDIGLLIDNKLIWNFEAKDYCDTSMYKRALADTKALKDIDSNIRTCVIAMQKSVPQDAREAWNECILSGMVKNYPEYYTLLSSIRKSKNNLYILNLSPSDVLTQLTALKEKIKNIL